ncbi:MAG: glycoside hydrolase family 6 protein [Patescibacteria group bacterium]|nr:glycoside hydrolase family 6 protein [Patescibacteria group bacterium]MDE1966657.1 glycoside hydrolase family 6 protein [Patescibacteria group bacterium]
MNTLKRFVLYALSSIAPFAIGAVAAHAATVSVWWPTDGATVGGTQPFKALVDSAPVDSYSMYWQVDNGQLNPMPTNNADYPHKEAEVDLSGWHWSSTGAYSVNFVAKDQNNTVIADRQVTIHVNAPTGSSATSVTAPAPAPAPIPTVDPLPTLTPLPSPSFAPTDPILAAPTPTPTLAPTPSPSESVWWPTSGAVMTGTQPFKAVMNGMPLSSYSMYWQVDNGQLNAMADNSTGGDHKEATVDLSGWNWHGTGPYMLTFIAKDGSGNTIASQNVPIYTGAPAVSAGSSGTTSGAPTSGTASVSSDPLSGLSFYVDPNSQAASYYQSIKSSDPTNAALIEKIASQPAAKWLGNWDSNIYSDTQSYVDAAAVAGQVPVLIAYNIPDRDCGGYSAGGAQTPSAYSSWISSLASGLGSHKAVIILEPDALASIDCLSSADQAARYSMLSDAVSALKSDPNAIVYLDAGNSNWIGAATMAARLQQAGIAKADGFALNVSNYYWTTDNVAYGDSVSALVGGKHFVVDTSRNGLGPLGSEWCNPPGRAIGLRDTASTGDAHADAFLWLKNPGESDGTCNGGPTAGVFWPAQAESLSSLAAY